MDPLGITPIIGLAEKVIVYCRAYISAVKDAPSDLRLILIEVSALKTILENVEFLTTSGADEDLSRSLQNLNSPDGPLPGCRTALMRLEELFPSNTETRKATLAQLVWPFQKRKAAEILSQIGQYKSTIALSLISDTVHNIGRLNSKLDHLCQAVDDDTKQKILGWLVTTDPSSNHNAACQLHDQHTGTWLGKSREYQEWFAAKKSFLWLYGIPGAGKTVLFSYIVENMKAHTKSLASNEIACVYYYCYFGRAQDETSHLLRWTLSQLVRSSQFIPTEIMDCFAAGQQPSIPILVTALASIAPKFQKIYLLIDALDESLDRGNLLDLLLTLGGPAFENISLLVMSREQSDIKAAIGPAAQGMSLSNPYFEEDIRTYIQNQLKTHRKLRIWQPELQMEIETGLVNGAQGMFRWAACQIEILGKLHSASDIRKALGELPETLDETYERMLLNFHPRHRLIAHKALQLLAFHEDMFDSDTDILVDAIIVDIEHLSFSPSDRFLNSDDIFEICLCLITGTQDGGVKLAHYTVREYLISERIRSSPATQFHITEESTHSFLCKTQLIYLLHVAYEYAPIASDYSCWDGEQQSQFRHNANDAFPFVKWCIDWGFFWSHVENETDREVIDKLALKWLDTQLARHVNLVGWEDRIGGASSVWKPGPGLESLIALGYACRVHGLVGVSKSILSQYPDLLKSSPCLEEWQYLGGVHRTLLEIAIDYEHEEMMELFLEEGADPNTFSPGLFAQPPLCTARGKPRGIVELLIRAGANPNPRGVAKTPLQLAAQCSEHDVIEFLLRAGAEVNGIGDDEAVQSMIRDDFNASGNEFHRLMSERGQQTYYKTPLSIALDREYWGNAEEREAVMDLLRRFGGKALHLFPVNGLPGYVEEDIESLNETPQITAELSNNSNDHMIDMTRDCGEKEDFRQRKRRRQETVR